MVQASLVMFEDESKELCEIIGKLLKEANAKSVYLVDKDGQLIGEKEFSILFHEGEKDNLHISIVGQRVILVVIFDNRSSLGLVRLRVRKAGDEINNTIQRILKRAEASQTAADNLLEEISDDDIENLFK